jgi:cytochrome P450
LCYSRFGEYIEDQTNELTSHFYPILQLVTYFASWSVYTLFLHPLSDYPGPKLAAITPLVHVVWDIQGKQHSVITSLHDKYGDVVRIAPNALAYRAASGWKDIYGHRKKGQKVFRKDPALYAPTPNGVNAIITAQEDAHQRMRRLLTHAFSNKALKAQEEILQTYADMLIEKLRGIMGNTSSQRIDIARWFNFTTFDLIGDLAFGEPFGCLSSSTYHWWVLIILDAVKASAYLKIFWFYSFLLPLAKFLVPKDLIEKRTKSFNLSVEKVRRRLARGTTRPDFTSYILKHTKEGLGMSLEEMDANSAVFVLAGSETTAALLCGAVYYLNRHRDKYQRLVREIRGSFAKEEDISLAALVELPYLNAVLMESMRVYPPIPSMLPRIVPEGGAMINERYVPGGVSAFLQRSLYCNGQWTSCNIFVFMKCDIFNHLVLFIFASSGYVLQPHLI